MKHYISLGAGVQSSVVALMAAHGEIEPMPDAAIFSDTKAEPKAVYAWLDWLEKRLPFPVHRVSKGDLEKDSIRPRTSKLSGRNYVQSCVPFWLKDDKGRRGAANRGCTRDYKINVIRAAAKERIVGLTMGARNPKMAVVTAWIGISVDEAHRMKPSSESWVDHRWPLIEKGMSRHDCKRWMERNGYPEPPRSACVFCPYHSDAEWQRLKTEDPESFQRAVIYEKHLQNAVRNHDEVLRGTPYLWHGLEPPDEAVFTDTAQMDLFGNECEGMCGV